jgi:predicted trehalose synthase
MTSYSALVVQVGDVEDMINDRISKTVLQFFNLSSEQFMQSYEVGLSTDGPNSEENQQAHLNLQT